MRLPSRYSGSVSRTTPGVHMALGRGFLFSVLAYWFRSSGRAAACADPLSLPLPTMFWKPLDTAPDRWPRGSSSARHWRTSRTSVCQSGSDVIDHVRFQKGCVFEGRVVQKRVGSRMDVLLLGLIDYPCRVEAVSLYEHESRRCCVLDWKN